MSKLKLLGFVLITAGVAAGAVYWFNQNPPGVTMINPARPPEHILEPAEVEKIRTLQNTKEVFLLGGVSPDDTTVMVMAGTGEDSAQASWLDLPTGQLQPIDSKLLEFMPQGESPGQTIKPHFISRVMRMAIRFLSLSSARPGSYRSKYCRCKVVHLACRRMARAC